MLDKKTLPLVIVLIAIVLFYYPILEFLGIYAPSEPDQQTKQNLTQRIADSLKQAGKQSTQKFVEAEEPVPEEVAPVNIDTVDVDTVIVSTNKYTLALSSRGGGPVSMKLRDHYYRNGEEIEMLPDADRATPDAVFNDGAFSSSTAHYNCNITQGTYDATRDTLEVIYEFISPDNGIIRKKYHFYPDTYHFDLAIEVENRKKLGFERDYSLVWNTPLGTTEPQMERDFSAMEAVAMQAGSREALDDFEDDTLHQSLEGYTSWVGVRSRYFTAVLIPRGREAALAFADGSKKEISTPDEGRIEQRLITAGMVMPFSASANSFTDSFTVFIGPMDYMLMWDYDVDLEDMLDVGTFPFFGMLLRPFAIAIMWLLPILYNIIPNYGLVIILFAILVKLITLPLSLKQFKSMQAMKELSPMIEGLKKKHKKDPQGLQKETMKLYKTHGVNPMSGCLVMLPQMPLMIAMFRVFQATVLLRAAPFVWFIDDLSHGASGLTDPYIILVVLMVGTQFISSKLTMASSQQQQKAFVYLLPLIMGFMLYSLPSGLILYWTIFSLLSLLDWFLFKRDKTKNVEVKTA